MSTSKPSDASARETPAAPTSSKTPTSTNPTRWIDIRERGSDKLLFRYDPRGRRVAVQRRRTVTIVYLDQFDPQS